MRVMEAVRPGSRLRAHAKLREDAAEYVIELDVAEFTEGELSVEAVGSRVVVHGDELETAADSGAVFRLHERLEESIRLPEDADADHIRVFYEHGLLEIHAPRARVRPRELPIERPAFRVHADAAAC